MTKPPFRLVGETRSQDTIKVLSELLEEARQGHVIGLAAVAVYKRRAYEFAITGESARSPTFTLGAISKLQFDVAQKVNIG